MMAHPGKKACSLWARTSASLSSGTEKKPLDWMLLGYDKHRELQKLRQGI